MASIKQNVDSFEMTLDRV